LHARLQVERDRAQELHEMLRLANVAWLLFFLECKTQIKKE
jgi:hypothetical protein